jgi:hypothetical protein
MTYKNMKKIDEILGNIDCIITDKNQSFEDLVFIDDEFRYDHHKKELVIEFEDKKIIYKDGILFKLNMFYQMLYNLDSGDFDSDLQMLDCFLRNFDYKFNYKDLSQEVKNVIPVRKEYGVYTKENDYSVMELEYYFKEIHYLLEDLDNL